MLSAIRRNCFLRMGARIAAPGLQRAGRVLLNDLIGGVGNRHLKILVLGPAVERSRVGEHIVHEMAGPCKCDGIKPYDMKNVSTGGVMTLAERMRQLRHQRRQSLQDVATAVGVSKAHVWELEQGRARNPSMQLVVRLADHFGGDDRGVDWRGRRCARRRGRAGSDVPAGPRRSATATGPTLDALLQALLKIPAQTEPRPVRHPGPD